ncbi:MAG: hypothetical protein AABZ74_02240 [Cyanobacteriota bacterium]
MKIIKILLTIGLSSFFSCNSDYKVNKSEISILKKDIALKSPILSSSIKGLIKNKNNLIDTKASVVLIEHGKENVQSDKIINKFKNSGEYQFEELGDGTYRVVFVLSTKDERINYTRSMYSPNDNFTDSYFLFLTTKSFVYTKDSNILLKDMDIRWKSDLKPYDKIFKDNDNINFSWNPAENAKSYDLLIFDENFNYIHKYSELSTNTFEWSYENRKNQNIKLEYDKKYYFSILINFNFSESDKTALMVGGSSLSYFKIKQ